MSAAATAPGASSVVALPCRLLVDEDHDPGDVRTIAVIRARRWSSPSVALPVASAAPAPISASGQTSESERPRPRSARITDQTSSTVPGDPAPARRRCLAGRRQEGPGAEVGDDAGAAREREQREGQPDERDVHRDRLRDAAADAREHAVVLHARDARERDRKAKRADAHPRCTSI